jgi:SEC-C motif
MIKSPLKGLSNHTEPFSVGDLDPGRSFVHVLDDTSLNIVLRTLDTIADFTAYLIKKESLLRSDQVVVAAGEEELLSFYLTRMNPDGQRDFVIPADFTSLLLTEGNWKEFQAHPQRLAQIEANKISYSWDRLIEQFNKHALQGTQYHVAPGGVQGTERVMAREPRTRRRMLAEGINELLRRTPPRQRMARVVAPSRPGDPFYVFLILPLQRELTYDENRAVRANLLQMYCRVVKIRFPEAEDIVGIATESGLDATERSEDAVYLDARTWTADDESEARRLQAEFGLLTKTREGRSVVQEYPRAERPPLGAHISVERNPRNKPCPCGSGLKYKKCHGR